MTNVQLIKTIQSSFLQEGREQIRTGMEVEVYQIIKEDAKGKDGGKERIQRFKGLVILTSGKSELEKTITVRRKIGAFGVEKVFAIHSPTIQKIEILRQFKVRRKSIKFIRDLTGKAARLKEVQNIVPKKAVKKKEAPKKEVIKESTKKTTPKKETPKTESTK